MISEKKFYEALVAYREAIRALPKTFPVQATDEGFRPDHIEGMKAALAVFTDEIAALRAKVEAQAKALKPFCFDNMYFDPVAKWDDETKIMVSFPKRRRSTPVSFFYVEHIKAARAAAQDESNG